MIKLNAKYQHHMTNFGPKIKQVNSHKNIQNVRITNEINTYYFYQSQTCENITRQPKTHQENTMNFPWILQEISAYTGVQIAKMQVQLARISKLRRIERQRPKTVDPAPALMDPDPQNVSQTLDWSGSPELASKGYKWRKMGRFWTDPVRKLHKRPLVRIQPFF